MRSFVLFIAAVSFPFSAMAQTPEKVVAPAVGDVVRIDADAYAFGAGQWLERSAPRIGDPDSDRFEMSCDVHPPFTATVIGVLDGTVVARYEVRSAKKEAFSCLNGSVVLWSSDGWASLRRAEETVAQAKAEKERRRESIRRLLGGTAPSSAGKR